MTWPAPATVAALQRASGSLSRAAVTRMEATLPWYRAMGPSERSWVGLIAQSGVAAFVGWLARGPSAGQSTEVSAREDVFGAAPPALTRAVSLQQTVELVRTTITVVEEEAEALVPAEEAATVREAILRYSREVAFAAADIYARAAEARGAWDARLEALVVASVTRGDGDDQVRSRAAALGWSTPGAVSVVVGGAPMRAERSPLDAEAVVAQVRRHAHSAGLDVLTGVHGDRLVVVLGGLPAAPESGHGTATEGSVLTAARAVSRAFGPGPVVAGPAVPDLLSASASAHAALAGLRAAAGWAGAPRPVAADDLLPERALTGDEAARSALVAQLYLPLTRSESPLLDTLTTHLEHGGSVEATARLLFVHPNTVRYRLRRIGELTGYWPQDARDAYALRIALTLGRLSAPVR